MGVLILGAAHFFWEGTLPNPLFHIFTCLALQRRIREFLFL